MSRWFKVPPIPSTPPIPPIPKVPNIRENIDEHLGTVEEVETSGAERRLEEAQTYLTVGDWEAAVSKIGPVFEHALRERYGTEPNQTVEDLINASNVDASTKARWHRWRKLRNEIAHEVSPGDNVRLARGMLEGVRRLVG